ncbi:MAG: Na+/H+ antiporter subunit E [Trueperaceae bacterium]|nr:Na+/H+ antiporter subunit E [Trueperaceae bacterium]
MKTTAALFAFWCVVVVPASLIDVLVGAVAALLVGAWAERFLWPHAGPLVSLVHPLRWVAFAWAHAGRMIASAVHVLRVVIDPRLPIDPEVVTQTVAFDDEAARVVYANAITVTPGTLTVDADGDTFVVHCLDAAFADEVRGGALARDVARLFEGRTTA